MAPASTDSSVQQPSCASEENNNAFNEASKYTNLQSKAEDLIEAKRTLLNENESLKLDIGAKELEIESPKAAKRELMSKLEAREEQRWPFVCHSKD